MGIILLLVVLLLLGAGGLLAAVYVNTRTQAAQVQQQFTRADQCHHHQQWPESVAAYRAALAAWQQSGSLLGLMKIFPPAAALARDMAHAQLRAQSNLALALQQTGALAEATDLLRQKLAAGQGSSSDYALLTELLAQQNRVTEAEPLVQQLKERASNLRDRLRSSGGNPDYHFVQGLVLAGQGKYDEAVEQLRTLIELDKDYAPRVVKLAALFLVDGAGRAVWEFFGTLFERHQQVAKAQECLERCLQAQPDDRILLERIAQLCQRSNRDQEALAWYEKLLRLKPDDVAVMRKMLQLQQQHQLTDAMIALHEKLQAYGAQQVEDQKALARLYQTAKRPDDAVRVVSALIESSPADAENYFLLADLYMRGGQSEKAIFAYERLLRQVGKGNTSMLHKVLPALEGMLKVSPEDPLALKLMVDLRDKLGIDSAKFRYRLARVKYAAGEFDEAFPLLQELWKGDSELKFKAGNLLGLCLLKRRNPDLALRHFQQMLAMDLEPELKREIAYHLGLTHEEAGNWEEAHRVFGDILLTAMEFRDVRERFEKAKAKLEEKRRAQRPASAPAAGAGSTMLDLNISRYDLKEELGRGGMGVVYRAHDTKLDRDVALKVLLTETADAAEFSERLLREARAAANLNHPNIVAIYDVGDSGRFKHIAMELATGGSLRGLLKRGGDAPLPQGEVKRLITEFAEAMAYAHSKGIVHRDIKPENIMLDAAKHVKVTDFGLARMETATTMTQPGMAMGTVHYMAPEQIRGEKPTPRVDIYAAGCMLFELLTGRGPFPGTDMASIIYNHLNTEPPLVAEVNPRLNPGWSPVVKKMLAKDVSQRYQSFLDVIGDMLMLEVG